MITFAGKRKDVTTADKKEAVKKYGDVKYADETNKKYPIDTEEHIRAAWNYINKEKNAAKYSSGEVKSIKSKIVAAWKSKIDKAGPPSAKEMSEVEVDAFKAGSYPQGEFGMKELNEIAETYDPEKYEAPAIIGHVSDYKGQTKIPAFAWVGKVKVVGDHLKLVFSQFSDQLKEWYEQGLYKKVSAAFYDPKDPGNPTPGKWHLHHLAFLGGQPPQVKGLEGIAFAEIASDGLAFAETDLTLEDSGETDTDAIEEMGTEDTIKDLTESCATFMSKIEDALTNDIDSDTQQTRCNLAAADLSSEITETLQMHWMFQEKLENIEEHQENEYAEKRSKFTQFIVELAQKLTNNKLKENEMDAQKEKELTEKIAAQEAQLKQFAEEKRLADEAKAKSEQEAKDAKIQGEIKEFCEELRKQGKYTKADDEAKMPEDMFKMAKSDIDYKKVFSARGTVVPVGEMKEFNEKATNDTRPNVIKNAEKYAKDHPKEFAGLTVDEATSRAVYQHSVGQIKLTGE